MYLKLHTCSSVSGAKSGVQAGLIYLYYLPMSYMMSRVSKKKDVHRAIPGLKIQQCCNLLGFNSNTIQVQ